MEFKHKREEITLTGHFGVVFSVALSNDENIIVSGSDDKTVKVWSLEHKREEFALTGHSGAVASVALSYDEKFVVSGSDDKQLKYGTCKKNEKNLL